MPLCGHNEAEKFQNSLSKIIMTLAVNDNLQIRFL